MYERSAEDMPVTPDHRVEAYWGHRGLVIPTHSRWPWYRVAAVGLAVGIITGGVLMTRLHVGLQVVLFPALLAIGVGLTYGRVRSSWPWYPYAGAHAFGWFVWLVGMGSGPSALTFGPWGTRLAAGLTVWLLPALVESLFCILLGCVVFPLVRSPFIIADGTRCPNCWYSLFGNASGVCPECGFGFVEWWRSMGAQVEYQDVNGEEHPTGDQPAP